MNVSENLIREIVKQVVMEQLGKTGPNASLETVPADFVKKRAKSGIIYVKTDTVKTEHFEQDGVSLKDLLTLEEAPRMGVGVMELDHTSFEWTLTYDEYDIVLDGTLEIETNGQIVTAEPGEIIYIPKNSHIHFQTPNKVRYAYFVYPADWQQ